MYRLFHYPNNASFVPHVCLRQIGRPFELVLVDRETNAHKQPDYFKLNPSGRIPTLVDGELVLFETAAICLYLADDNPESRLAPAATSVRERATFHKWLFYLSTTIQPELLVYHYPNRYGTDKAGVQAGAEARLNDMFEIMDEAVSAGPFLMGAQFTLLDPYLTMLCRWARNLTNPPRDKANLAPYLERNLAQPCIAEAFRDEGVTESFV